MAHIEHSVKLQEACVALSKSDCAFLIPYLKKSLQKEEKLVEKYQGILEGGEATDRQTTALNKHTDRAETMAAIVYEVEYLTSKRKTVDK